MENDSFSLLNSHWALAHKKEVYSDLQEPITSAILNTSFNGSHATKVICVLVCGRRGGGNDDSCACFALGRKFCNNKEGRLGGRPVNPWEAGMGKDTVAIVQRKPIAMTCTRKCKTSNKGEGRLV